MLNLNLIKNITFELCNIEHFSTIFMNWEQSKSTGLASMLKHKAIIIG